MNGQKIGGYWAMSKEDRAKWEFDFAVFGRAMWHEHEDGTVTYLPPEKWTKEPEQNQR